MGNVVEEQELPEFRRWIEEVPSEEKISHFTGSNGKLQNSIWYAPEQYGNVIHRDPSEGPSYRYYDMDTGKLKVERYLVKGELHREDGPALRRFDNLGLFSESYFLCGYLHREDGPARIEYSDNQTVDREIWMFYDNKHRAIEPADILYDEDGCIVEKHYYNHGVKITVPDGYDDYDDELKSFTWEMLVNVA